MNNVTWVSPSVARQSKQTMDDSTRTIVPVSGARSPSISRESRREPRSCEGEMCRRIREPATKVAISLQPVEPWAGKRDHESE